MRIAVNTDNYEILNSIIRAAKEHGDTVLIAKLEKSLFNYITNVDEEDIDAYILTSNTHYAQKAVDFIKKEFPYAPVAVIGRNGACNINSVDIFVPYEDENNTDFLADALLHNIYAYTKNFLTLQKVTAKLGEVIHFGNCSYDPIKRIMFCEDKEIQKLSPKQAGIFELLAANFGKVVNKDVILVKVWDQSNYFVSRSLDVFVTHLRRILKDGKTNMTITNVSNIGLMLDYLPNVKK